MLPSTAILLFARTATAESRAKAFGRGTRMADALLQRTQRILAGAGLPVVRSDEADQRGNAFGQRLARAVSGVFDRGYARVIVVGSDCALLQTSHLRAAAQTLERGGNVLGPDRRGGAWLIGLQRADFEAERFAQLRWETADIFTDLAELLPDTESLPLLDDLNAVEELRTRWCWLRSVLGHLYDLVFMPEPKIIGTSIRLSAAVFLRLASRGPPRGHGL